MANPLDPFSHSRLSTFAQCALKFRYQYVDGLPQKPGTAAVKGNVVHLVLEKLLALPASERTPETAASLVDPALDELLSEDPQRAFAIDTTQVWPGEPGPIDPLALKSFVADCHALIRNYFKLEDPVLAQPLWIEKFVEMAIGDARFVGYIDRVDRLPDGRLVVADYKTPAPKSPQYEQPYWDQLTLYAAMLEAIGERVAELRLHYLGGSAPETRVHTASSDEIASLKHKLNFNVGQVRRAVESGDYPPKPGKLCDWCDFASLCPAKGGKLLPLPGTN